MLLREGLEDLLQAHHVDLVIQAHRHNYQVPISCPLSLPFSLTLSLFRPLIMFFFSLLVLFHVIMTALQATWPVFQANATAKSYNSPTSPVYVLCGAAGVRPRSAPLSLLLSAHVCAHVLTCVQNKEHLNGVSPSQDWARFALEEYGYGMDILLLMGCAWCLADS